jgi:hypothetical protein
VIDVLLARSGYVGKPGANWPKIDDPMVERGRAMLGGHLSTRPEFVTDWLLQNRKDAMEEAAAGKLRSAALLWKSVLSDGVFSGVFNLRCAGIVTLPRKFRGNADYVAQLQEGHESVQSVYDAMIPPDQSKLMIQDGIGMGVAVGELLKVPGRSYPVLRRLPPEGLVYIWSGNQGNWFYRSQFGGLLPIVKGDGNWVLWEPAGVDAAPWERGIWYAASRSFILKENAALCSGNLERGMANPGIVTTAPVGASQGDRESWFMAFSHWGANMLASAPSPGFDAKVLEVGSEGSDIFDKSIARWDRELTICAAGQEVTTTGGTGFLNNNLFQTIRKEFIQEPADSWAMCVNTQILPQWTIEHYGLENIEGSPCVEFDTRSPQDLTNSAQSWIQCAAAVEKLEPMLEKYGRELDIEEVIAQYSIPVTQAKGEAALRVDIAQIKQILEVANQAGLQAKPESMQLMLERASGLEMRPIARASATPRLMLAPNDIAKAVKVDEVRRSQGLDPIGGEEGEKKLADVGKDSEPAKVVAA